MPRSAETTISFQPAWPAKLSSRYCTTQGAPGERFPKCCPVYKSKLHRRQTARAGGENNFLGDRLQRQWFSVYQKRQTRSKHLSLLPEVCSKTWIAFLGDDARTLHLLIRRNLRHINQVAHLDEPRLDADPGVMIDTEIAHGMCEDISGSDNREHSKEQEEPRNESCDTSTFARI